jgi:Homeobox KN domain
MSEFYSFFSNNEFDADLDGSITELYINDPKDVFPCNNYTENQTNHLNEYDVNEVSPIEIEQEDAVVQISNCNFDDHDFDFDSPITFNDILGDDALWMVASEDVTSRTTDVKEYHNVFDNSSAKSPNSQVSAYSVPAFVTPDSSPSLYFNEGGQLVNNRRIPSLLSQPAGYRVLTTSREHKWNLTKYERRDSFSHAYITKIKDLASNFESRPIMQSKDQTSMYSSIQDNFELHFKNILRDSCSPHAYDSTMDATKGTRYALDSLYEDTIMQLNDLIASDVVLKNSESWDGMSLSNGPSHHQQMNHSSFGAKINATASKKEFVTYMTAWLRDNWTNPYNDDEGLEDMAAATGTTTEVISNWLINARTRKWRPALRKALALNRPARLLLEDSLNLFDRKPVRELGPNEIVERQYVTQYNNNVTKPFVCSSTYPLEVFPLYEHQQWQQETNPLSDYMEKEAPVQTSKRMKTHYNPM